MRVTPQLPRLLDGPTAIVVDTRARTVDVAGAPVVLTRLSFDILTVLLDRRGEVVNHDELAELAWGYEATDDRGAIQTGIYRLRLALKVAGATSVIRAVRGVGYTVDSDPQSADPLRDSTVDAALRAVPSPTLFVGPSGRPAVANDAAAALIGADIESLERLPSWLTVLSESSWPGARAAFGAASAGERPAPIQASAINQRDARAQPVRLHIAPVEGRGHVTGVLVTLVPTTAPTGY